MDVEDAINLLSNQAAPGPDGIPTICLKQAKGPISRMLNSIFQKSYAYSDVPDDLKLAFITPIHKGGTRTEPANFRPVSLTSHTIKTFERVVRKEIVNFLEIGGKMDPSQHGSRSGRSTLSQLLHSGRRRPNKIIVIACLPPRANNRLLPQCTGAAGWDIEHVRAWWECRHGLPWFAKAFDKCDHGILLKKMKALGIKGRLGRWIHSFLSHRKQMVVVKGHKSGTSSVVSGVPQGSVLGPILFLIYISDIGENVDTNLKIYVDDSKAKEKIKEDKDV